MLIDINSWFFPEANLTHCKSAVWLLGGCRIAGQAPPPPCGCWRHRPCPTRTNSCSPPILMSTSKYGVSDYGAA